MTRSFPGRCPFDGSNWPLFLSIAVTIVLLSAGGARAQSVILPELPFTSKDGVGARAAGLGYA